MYDLDDGPISACVAMDKSYKWKMSERAAVATACWRRLRQLRHFVSPLKCAMLFLIVVIRSTSSTDVKVSQRWTDAHQFHPLHSGEAFESSSIFTSSLLLRTHGE